MTQLLDVKEIVTARNSMMVWFKGECMEIRTDKRYGEEWYPETTVKSPHTLLIKDPRCEFWYSYRIS